MDYWQQVVIFFKELPWIDIGISIAIFLLFLLFRKIFTSYIYKIIVRLSRKTPTELFTNVLLAYEKPVRIFFVILGTYLALLYLPFNITTISYVNTVYEAAIILLIGWGLYNFTSEHSTLFIRLAKKTEVGESSMLVPFLSKLLRFVVIAITLAIVLDVLGFQVGTFVAGLGIGGLAFALAAQDTLGNFFGGIIIISEKPFKKGDWIETPSVEGTIEDITFRSTKIRTFAHAVVTVPNSKLANEPITNWSMMGKRRITFNLGVMYTTPREKLEKVVRKIEHLLRTHEEIDQDLILVNFDTFDESSFGIFLYFFTKTTQWDQYLKIKEDINLSILQILEEEGVTVSVPGRSVVVENKEVAQNSE